MAETSGTAQGGGIPPVEDADINPAPEKTTEEQETKTPKTEKKDDTSQPPKKETEAKEKKGPGPWDAELQKRGIASPEFDSFLREVVQPYVTQLEQSGSGENPFGDPETAQAAADFWSNLVEDPEATFNELGELLREQGLLGLGDADEDGGELGDPGVDDDAGDPDPRSEYIDQLMERERMAQEDAEYEEALSPIREKFGETFDEMLFGKLVVANGGNLDAAMQDYEPLHKAPPEKEPAPPTLDGGGTPPREAPKHTSLDSAIDGWLAESKASRPTR